MEERHNHPASLVARGDQPLIGVIFNENGQDIVCYSPADTAEAPSSSSVTNQALGVIGAWSDLDWDETKDALDRIRHESVPTPPIEP